MSIITFRIEGQSDKKVVAYLDTVTPRLIVAVHRAMKLWLYGVARTSTTKYFAAGQSVVRGSKNTGSILISRKGTLRRSVTASVASGMTPATPSPNITSISAQIGAATSYARIQEKGGYAGRGHRSYIPPRPYLAPAVRDNLPELEGALIKAMNEAIA